MNTYNAITRPRPCMGPAARLIAVISLVTLTGCAGLSGLNGSSSFRCSAPAGIPCQSVSGVHMNERAGNLPSQRGAAAEKPQQEAAAAFGGDEGYMPSAAAPSAGPMARRPAEPSGAAQARPAAMSRMSQPLGAIRSDPTVIRIWVAPWEDADGDLNDQSYVYLQIDSGRWLIEHNRERIRREFTPSQRAAAGTAAVAALTSGWTPSVAVAGNAAANDPLASREALAAIAEGQRRAQLAAAGRASGTPMAPSAPAAPAAGGAQP